MENEMNTATELNESSEGKGHGDKMDRYKEQAIAALLTYPSIKKAAQAIGVGEATLGRWLKDTEFRKEYELARQESLKLAIDSIDNAFTAAVQTICDVMADTEAPANSRLSAAKTIIENHFRIVEAQKLEKKVDNIEQYLTGVMPWM